MTTITLDYVYCAEDTNESSNDEPYVIVATIDLASMVTVSGFPVPIPQVEVFLYGPYENVTKSRGRPASRDDRPFWPIEGIEKPINSVNDVIFVVALMENDDGSPEALRGTAKAIVTSTVFASLGQPRSSVVSRVIADLESATRIPTGAPNFDDRIGTPQELTLSEDRLDLLEGLIPFYRTLDFSGDGGFYRVRFRADSLVSGTGFIRGYRITQASSGRFLDAYERGNGQSAVTRPQQTDQSQWWDIEPVGTLQKLTSSVGAYLDAHEVDVGAGRGNSVVTRGEQSDDTQIWGLIDGGSFIQLSSGRQLDSVGRGQNVNAHTEVPNQSDSQKWTAFERDPGTMRFEQRRSHRYLCPDVRGENVNVVSRDTAINDPIVQWRNTHVGFVVHLRQRSSGFALIADQAGDFTAHLTNQEYGYDQLWAIKPDGDLYTIQHMVTGRYLDAHEVESADFRCVTRPKQSDQTQHWSISV